MRSDNIRTTVAKVSQNKRIRAIALEVINGMASVKIAGSSKKMYGLPVTGGTIVAGQEVYIDFTTGTPVVHSYSSNTSTDTSTRVKKARVIIADPDLESQGSTSTTGSGIEEAPIDGKQYARKDAAWSEVTTSGSGTSGSGIEEAPIDGTPYARQNGSWTEITTSGSTSGSGIADAPADGKTYGRKDNAWSEVVVSSGSPTSGSPIVYGGELLLKQNSSGSNIFTVNVADNYDYIKIFLSGQLDQMNIAISFNNDVTDANYERDRLTWTDGIVSSADNPDRNVSLTSGSSSGPGSQSEITILNPGSTSIYKIATAINTKYIDSDTLHSSINNVCWRMTSAITNIRLTGSTNFPTNVQCVIVGFKNMPVASSGDVLMLQVFS